MRRALLIALSAIMASASHGSASASEKIHVVTSKRDFVRFSSAQVPDTLTFLGGITLDSEFEEFGGFSGLDVSPDGKSFLSVSDRGNWLSGQLVYENGRLVGVKKTRMAPIRNRKGKPYGRKSRSDAEAVAAWGAKGISGKVIVGFERKERVEQFNIAKHGLQAPARRLRAPKGIKAGQYNGEIEAIGRFFEGPMKGWMIAISERNQARDDSLRGWLWRKGKSHEFNITRHEDYRITGLAILPGGEEIVTVERSFKAPIRVGMALRRFKVADLQKRKSGAGKLLFAGMLPAFKIDNMEGIAAHKDARGTVLTVISDDNFNSAIQSTVMFQFRLN